MVRIDLLQLPLQNQSWYVVLHVATPVGFLLNKLHNVRIKTQLNMIKTSRFIKKESIFYAVCNKTNQETRVHIAWQVKLTDRPICMEPFG